ncbi:MAG: helix-turn-helix transcriptional regulator [Methylococcaceae bacterium]
MKYGQRLKLAREQVGLTQKELSLLTGVKWRTIAQIERGNQNASYSTVALANALMIEPMWLYSGDDQFAPEWFVVSELELLAIKQQELLKRQAVLDQLRAIAVMDNKQRAKVIAFVKSMLNEGNGNPLERRINTDQRLDFDNQVKPDQTYQDVIKKMAG